ncbi:MAG: hypothetical protein EXQ69_09670 [Acidimicrobiia bacterium]|nr:hypothetical protein [Acidimicrobiia bacterium]
MRFPSPLLVGSQFRIHSVLDNVRHLDRVTEIVTSHEGEIERGESPWFVASDLVSNIIVKEAFAL